MKLFQLEHLTVVLQKLSEKELPIQLSYKIARLSSLIKPDAKFLSEKMQEFINTYAERDVEGNIIQEQDSVKINLSMKEEAEKRIQEIYDTEIDDPDIKFTLKELESITLSPSDLQPLMSFISEE